MPKSLPLKKMSKLSTDKDRFFKLLNLAATTRVKGEARKDESSTPGCYTSTETPKRKRGASSGK